MVVGYVTADRLHALARAPLGGPDASGFAPPDPLEALQDSASLDLTETAGALTGQGDSDLLTGIGVVEGLRDAVLGAERIEDGRRDHSRLEVADGVARATLAAASMAPGLAGEVFAAMGGLYNVASGAAHHDRLAELSGLFQVGAAAGLLAMMGGYEGPTVCGAILTCEFGRMACRAWAHASRHP